MCPERVPTYLIFQLQTMFDCTAPHSNMSCVVPWPHLLTPKPSAACDVPLQVKMQVLLPTCTAAMCMIGLCPGAPWPAVKAGRSLAAVTLSAAVVCQARRSQKEVCETRDDTTANLPSSFLEGRKGARLTVQSYPTLVHGSVPVQHPPRRHALALSLIHI